MPPWLSPEGHAASHYAEMIRHYALMPPPVFRLASLSQPAATPPMPRQLRYYWLHYFGAELLVRRKVDAADISPCH